MKIAQVAHLFPPATGGIEHHTYEISKELASSGWNAGRNDAKNEVTVFTSSVLNSKKEEMIEGFKVRRFFSINLPVFSSVRFAPMLFPALLFGDFDIYCSHGYGSFMPFFTSIAAWIRRKPFVFTLHGYPKLAGFSGFFQSIYKIFCASVFLRIASRVIVVSKASINDIAQEVDGRKIVYIPNGIEADEFGKNDGGKPFGSFETKNKITYVGRLDEYKGVDVLIRAFAKIKKEYPKLDLVIAGRDEGIKKDLEALSTQTGANATFVDVPRSEIGRIYAESKAIVLPSKYEGFSLVWLEAIASGRPMFSTPVGDAEHLFSQVYGGNEAKFIFGNEDELVQKLSYFLFNEKEFVPIVSKAQDICRKEYSWRKVAEQTMEVYKEVVK
ncbi:MAG: glycosyltransferase family 4 protein [Candidatus Micrarchaeia archaeon]|jgi:glycosyltransferase involved in cell wall biosynthesis